jgi:hypothetical protein
MKAFPLIPLAICISILLSITCILNVNLVSALDQNELSMVPSWSSVMYYQNDTNSVKLILTNNSPDALTIYFIGVHFDWMNEDDFSGLNLSENPLVVTSQKTYVFDPMIINIPADVSIGRHNYTIAVEGTQGEAATRFSWTSPPKEIYIQHHQAKTFNELLHNVTDILTQNVTYQSTEAQNLIDQANTEYTQGVLASYSEQWDDAISHMQNSLNYAEQAQQVEQSSATQNADLMRILWIVAPLATLVIVAFIVIIVWKRRQPPDTEDQVNQPADQSFEEQPETQDFTPEE